MSSKTNPRRANTKKRNTDNEYKRKVGNGLEIPGANFGGRVGIQIT
jgi:hypothetical protein